VRKEAEREEGKKEHMFRSTIETETSMWTFHASLVQLGKRNIEHKGNRKQIFGEK